MSNTAYIKKTEKWIRNFVIALNLCPFAKREMDSGSVRMEVCTATTISEALTAFMAEIKLLDNNTEEKTSFLIFPFFLKDFFDYLDFIDVAESSLIKSKQVGTYQLATFHPDYYFADADPEDVTNYTNRSPYPMIHFLREAEVEKAITYYGDTEQIPINNMICLRKLGLDEVKRLRKK